MEQELLETIKAQVLANYGIHKPNKEEVLEEVKKEIPQELLKMLEDEKKSKIARYASEWEPVEQKK